MIVKFNETDQLLIITKLIDPELYEDVSQVTNSEGSMTHVYVRYVNRTAKEFTFYIDNHFKANAYTSVRQAADNKNVCESLYETNLITVSIGKGCDEKLALGHEFAHVLYIVPNLSEYTEFLNNNNCHVNNKFCVGHSPFDPGYVFINAVEDQFKARYKKYLKGSKNSDSIAASRECRYYKNG